MTFFASIMAGLLIVALFAVLLSNFVSRYQDSPSIPPTPVSENVFRNDDGSLKYAVGTCSTDSDCYVAGCSSEMCADTLDLITTCEVKPDAPDPSMYSCGCYEGNCAWISK